MIFGLQYDKRFPLLHPRHKKLVIGIITAIILSFSTFFWYFLNFIEVAVLKTDKTFTALVSSQPLDSEEVDRSKLEIFAQGNQAILVHLPDDSKAGRTAEDLVFQEGSVEIVERVVIEEKIPKDQSTQYLQWRFIKANPDIGKYTFEIYSQQGSDVTIDLVLTDRSGVYVKTVSKVISLEPGQTRSYQLFYHKDLLHRTIFRPKPSYPMFQGLNILHAYFAPGGADANLPKFMQP